MLTKFKTATDRLANGTEIDSCDICLWTELIQIQSHYYAVLQETIDQVSLWRCGVHPQVINVS